MRVIVIASTAVLLLVGVPSRAEDGEPAEAGFARIREIARAGTEEQRKTILPGRLVERRRRWTEADTAKWRVEFCRRLAAAKRAVVSEGEGRAVARVPDRRGDLAILLRRDGASWIVDCAEPYVVGGPALERTRGRRAARVTLRMRDDGVPFAPCAYSFGYVTQRTEKCHGITDVWFGRCGRLHATRGPGIYRVGAVPLEKIVGLPGDREPATRIEAERGVSYALHCRRDGHYDFWVKLRVLDVEEDALTLEWELLALGPGAPDSIHRTQHFRYPHDGADGAPGMCGRGYIRRTARTPREGGTGTGGDGR